MKRAAKSDQNCRRQEFVCRLYDVIKDLDKSLKTDCNQGAGRFMREKGNPFDPRPKPTHVNKKNGPECRCPPGCCENSLIFKLDSIPNYPGLTDEATLRQNLQPSPLPTSQAPPGANHPHHDHHNHHPDPSQYPWHRPQHNNGCWALHDHQVIPGAPQGPAPQQPFTFPGSPEEAMARGCFVAKAA